MVQKCHIIPPPSTGNHFFLNFSEARRAETIPRPEGSSHLWGGGLKIGFKMVLFQSNFEHIRRNIAACNTLYTNSSFLSIFSFFHFPHPSFFPQQSFTSFPTTIGFFSPPPHFSPSSPLPPAPQP